MPPKLAILGRGAKRVRTSICYLAIIVSTLTKLKNHMSQRRWEVLHGIPFAHLMEVEPVMQDRGVLDTLMQMYNDRIQCFYDR